jgi:hypothetical protein
MTVAEAAPTTPEQTPLVPCNWFVTLKVEEMARSVEFNSWGAETTLSGNARVTTRQRFSFVGHSETLVGEEREIQVWLKATDETRAPEKSAIPWTASLTGGGDPYPYWVSLDVRMPPAHLERIYALLLKRAAWMSLHVRVDGILATSSDGKVDVAYFPEASDSQAVTLPAHITRMEFQERSFAIGGEKRSEEIKVNRPPPERDIALEFSNSLNLNPIEALLKKQVFALWMIWWGMIAVAAAVLILWLHR